MPNMLASLGLELVGRHHRGIDDCHDIERGVIFDVMGKLSSSHYPELPIVLRRGDEAFSAVLTRRRLASLVGLASGPFRTEIAEVRTADGSPRTEDVLQGLPTNATLLAVSTR